MTATQIKNKIDNISELVALQKEYADNIKFLETRAYNAYFQGTECKNMDYAAYKELKPIVSMINDYINLIIESLKDAEDITDKLFNALAQK